MGAAIENSASPPEIYVVEIDGETRLVSGIFIDALKAGFELKQKFPHTRLKCTTFDNFSFFFAVRSWLRSFTNLLRSVQSR
jgi:hypothetical protein